jgi:hypothetical protein
MNQLKDYMMSQNQTLKKAFRWKTSTLPSKNKKDSVSYYQAREVALISSLTLGAAAFFLQRAFLPPGLLHFLLSILVVIATFFVQLFIYQRALR